MCGLCGIFTEMHWTAAPVSTARPGLGRTQLAAAAAEIAAESGVRVAVWGQGFRVIGPTGRAEIVADLAALWRAIDRLGRAQPDPLGEPR